MQSSIATQEVSLATSSRGPGRADRHIIHLLIIVAIWAVLYVPGMYSPALLDDADSVHAEAAREMMQQGQWSTLYVNGLRYLEKAPFMYWGMALSFKLFGVSEWSARLPLALGTLAALLAIYSFGRRWFDARAGLYAAIIIATSFGPYIFTRILIPEILVCLWLTLGFDFFLRGLNEERPSRLSSWGLAATAALGVLTKGLIGLVFPGAIIVGYLLLTGKLKHLLRMRLVSSFLVFLVIAAPWHIAAGLANPAAGESKGFFWFYFINEHLLRYLNKRFPKDYDTVPFGIFWGMMVLWLIPWSAFVFKGFGQIPVKWRQLRERLDARGRALLLCAIWAAFILIFFSFSSRQEYYTVPALPGVALIIGAWLSREQASAEGSPERRAGRRVAAVMMAIAIPAFSVAMMLLWHSVAVPKGADLADILTKNPEKYALSFGHIFDLNPQAMGVFRAPLAISSTALLLGTIACWWLRRRGRVAYSNVALTLMMIVFLHCAHRGLEIFEPVLSSKAFLPAIQKYHQPGDVIVINGAYEDGSTLNFYGQYQLHVLNTRTNGNLYYGSLFPDSPNVFEDNGSFERKWNGPRRVFLWTEEDKIPFLLTYTPAYLVTRGGGKLILTNKKLPDRPDTLWVPDPPPTKQALSE